MNKVIILAAGKGTRMQTELPKVLKPLKNRPMIEYLIESILKSGLTDRPLLIVSPDNQEIIKNHLHQYNLDYALQLEQLGTGHAVASVKEQIQPLDYENIIVLYGDHPFITPTSLIRIGQANPNPITMMTTKVADFSDWRRSFYHWGRIVRNKGEVQEIIEFKDASESQREITEVNPALFAFNSHWLWENITQLKTNNQQKEYYLTDLIKLATNKQLRIKTLEIKPEEAVGINTPEELAIAEQLLS